MADPVFETGMGFFFQDLGATKGLKALTGLTMGLAEATKNLRDKTFAATGSVRGFADAGKEGFVNMSANLSRTAVLQGKVYSQTEGIMSAQLDASVRAAENINMVQELQKEFEAVGKATVGNIGDFAELQKVLQVPASALASWDKTLEAQGFSEKQVIGLTKELGGLSRQLGVEPGPLLAQMPDLARLVLERAATLGKEGVPYIKKYMKENIGLSAALTSQGLHADEAAGAVVSLSKLTFDSAKQMNAALAGVSEGSMPEFLRMANISLGDFKTSFQLASKEGPLALVEAFRKKTEEIRKNTKNDKRAMQNWRQFMDKTIGDPALVELIVDGQKDIGKALRAVNSPDLIKDYDALADGALKNAQALRDRRDAAWEALKVDSAQKLVIPLMTDLWQAQSKALVWGKSKLDEWSKSGSAAQATIAGLAGATVLYSGDVLDWATKAGGAVKNLKELGTGFSDLAKVLPGIGAGFGKAGGALQKFGGIAKAVALFDIGAFAKSLTGLPLFIRGTLIPTIQIGATTAFTTFATTLTGTVIPALGTFAIAAAPVLAIAAALAAAFAAIGLGLTIYQKHAEAAGEASRELGRQQTLLATQTMKQDPALFAKYQKERSALLGRKDLSESMKKELEAGITQKYFGRAQKKGLISMETKVPATGPTPALRIGALPHGGAEVRLAIQMLEESRAQTGILEHIAAAISALGSMAAPAAAGSSSMRIDMRPDSGALRLDRMLEVRARNVLGRAGYTQFGRTAFTH